MPKPENTMKFFYVSAKCVKLINIDGCDDEDEGNITPKFDSGSPDSNYASENLVEKNGKKYKPAHITVSTTIPAPMGRFIPSMMEKHIKDMARCEEVCINFVREMTQEEFDADVKYRMELKELEENGPPLDNATQFAIDDLIERTEKGEVKTGELDSSKSNKAPDVYNPLTDNIDELFED